MLRAVLAHADGMRIDHVAGLWRLWWIPPYDVIAEPRQPNLPGTIDEYPNWRLPLPITLEQLRADSRVAEITAAFRVKTS